VTKTTALYFLKNPIRESNSKQIKTLIQSHLKVDIVHFSPELLNDVFQAAQMEVDVRDDFLKTNARLKSIR
jgi:hypothetical protein